MRIWLLCWLTFQCVSRKTFFQLYRGDGGGNIIISRSYQKDFRIIDLSLVFFYSSLTINNRYRSCSTPLRKVSKMCEIFVHMNMHFPNCQIWSKPLSWVRTKIMQIIFRVLDRLLTSVILVKSTMFFAIYHLGTAVEASQAGRRRQRLAGSLRPYGYETQQQPSASSINLQETYFLCHW